MIKVGDRVRCKINRRNGEVYVSVTTPFNTCASTEVRDFLVIGQIVHNMHFALHVPDEDLRKTSLILDTTNQKVYNTDIKWLGTSYVHLDSDMFQEIAPKKRCKYCYV